MVIVVGNEHGDSSSNPETEISVVKIKNNFPKKTKKPWDYILCFLNSTSNGRQGA